MNILAPTSNIILTPIKVTATEFEPLPGKPTLTICVTVITKVLSSPVQIEPVDLNNEIPTFRVVQPESMAFGSQDVTVTHTFEGIKRDLTEIIFITPTGIQTYPISIIIADKDVPAHPKDILNVTDNQIVGFAYNQSNLDIAFNNAVTQLYQNFPGHISAKVVSSGFVAFGSPIGISYTYVVVEQQ